MTYEAARYVPVVSTAMAAVLGVAKLSRQFGAYGIAGFLHRADIAKVGWIGDVNSRVTYLDDIWMSLLAIVFCFDCAERRCAV
jgi:hypothetical protein